jgi:hypothetical protein
MPRGVYQRSQAAEVAPVEAQTEAPQPVRETRAEQTRRERRRRDDGDFDRMSRLKLAIPHDIQEQADREGKTLRWVRDTPDRLAEVHRNDWDPVAGVGAVPADGDSGVNMVLHSKYRDWFEDDRRKRSELLNERDKALMRGAKASPDDKRQESTSYVPQGNRISRQQGV